MMATHVRVVAVLYLVLGVLGLAGAAAAWSVTDWPPSLTAEAPDDEALTAAVLGITGMALTGFLLVSSIPAVACGVGLLRRRPWARLIALVLASLALLRIPFGTLLGTYVLWVLLNREVSARFKSAQG